MSARWSQLKVFYSVYGLKLYKAHTVRNITRSILQQRRHLYSSCQQCAKAKPTEYIHTYTSSTKPGDKKDTSCPLPPTHSPQYVEAAWYEWWVKEGFFAPKAGSQGEQEKFVLCLPPPNVTGTLHLGHALTCAIQDALVRWHRIHGRERVWIPGCDHAGIATQMVMEKQHRMHGHETVWIPGCDHAGIATQVVVEKQLWRERKQTQHDLGREKFLEAVWDWKNRKGDTIYEQLRRLGASLDWSRGAFTMDKKMQDAVCEAFVRLHDEGLIYRGNRLVNWSCDLNSAISDIEVDNLTLAGPTKLTVPGYSKPQKFGELVYFDYPVVDSDERITVATTRLETMLGDTGVAVHPQDERYRHLHGKYVQHPLDGRHIPVVCDDYVDKDFGTGAVKITPSHDPNDYELGLRHELDFINVIDDAGKMENVAERFLGVPRFEARWRVLAELKNLGLFKEKKPHAMSLPTCSRSKDVIEPRIKSQWFVDCSEMTDIALKCVENGELKFTPDYYKKVWFEFLKEKKNWCISRQIWWGHRIPAYRVLHTQQQDGVESQDEVWVSGRNQEEAYNKAEKQFGSSRDTFTLQQDEDVLDTWFSSALFPFSVNGWPDQTEDLARYYPSSLLETGNDIIFFWVARMVMMGCKLTGQLPFKEVLLHGTLRDAAGRKMSKSLGNVIDPMAVIEGTSLESLQSQLESSNLDPREIEVAKKNQVKDFPNGIPACGADALRFGLCSYNFKDMEINMNILQMRNYLHFYMEINMNILHMQNYRHFCNKMWQAFRYVDDKLPSGFTPSPDITTISPSNKIDQWFLSRLSNLVEQCDKTFASYDLHFTTRALYEFWFHDFCDVYVEYTKLALQSSDDSVVFQTRELLHLCMDTYLRALSPFMPYLTEELYQRLPPRGDVKHPSVCVAPYPKPEQYCWHNRQLEREMTLVRETCTGIMSLIQGYNLPRKTSQVFVRVDETTLETLSHYTNIFTVLTRLPSVTMVTSDADIPLGSYPKMINPDVKIFVKTEVDIDFDAELGRIEKKQKALEQKLQTFQKKVDKLNTNNNAIPDNLNTQIEQTTKQLEELENSANTLKQMKNR